MPYIQTSLRTSSPFQYIHIHSITVSLIVFLLLPLSHITYVYTRGRPRRCVISATCVLECNQLPVSCCCRCCCCCCRCRCLLACPLSYIYIYAMIWVFSCMCRFMFLIWWRFFRNAKKCVCIVKFRNCVCIGEPKNIRIFPFLSQK